MSMLGMELKRIREKKGLSITEVSKKVGISREYLRLLEKGERNASFTTIGNIAALYLVPLDYFRSVELQSKGGISIQQLNQWFKENRTTQDKFLQE